MVQNKNALTLEKFLQIKLESMQQDSKRFLILLDVSSDLVFLILV